jgi:hypothetical protein
MQAGWRSGTRQAGDKVSRRSWAVTEGCISSHLKGLWVDLLAGHCSIHEHCNPFEVGTVCNASLSVCLGMG